MTNEDEMHNILFEDAEFILSEFVDGDITELLYQMLQMQLLDCQT